MSEAPPLPPEEPVPSSIPLVDDLPRIVSGQGRWSAQLVAVLLLVQAAFLAGVVIYHLAQVNWSTEIGDATISTAEITAARYLALFSPLCLLLLAAAVLALLRRRSAWVFAMILQCIILLLCLQTWFADPTGAVIARPVLYLGMAGSILVVFYLNSPEGRLLLARR